MRDILLPLPLGGGGGPVGGGEGGEARRESLNRPPLPIPPPQGGRGEQVANPAQTYRLGDDVGEELILDAGDLVLEGELLLFQALKLKRVGAARFLQRIDGAVEVAVLLLEPEQRRPELANLLALHRTSPAPCLPLGTGESIAANRGPRKGLGAFCQPVWSVDESVGSDSRPQGQH